MFECILLCEERAGKLCEITRHSFVTHVEFAREREKNTDSPGCLLRERPISLKLHSTCCDLDKSQLL